jgi:hypothetical protein
MRGLGERSESEEGEEMDELLRFDANRSDDEDED